MSATDLQALLRFLTKDAKVPLATAMSTFKDLQAAELATPETISKSDINTMKKYFPDEKTAKLVLSAAKRVSKKRSNDDAPTTSPSTKKRKADPFETPGSVPAAEVEASLELPSSNATIEQMNDMVFTTNRAPLVLAFALSLLKITMPEQPPSSRLSLAQAVVSRGAQSKAKSIGIASGPTAEDEGWAKGQPVVTVMGREISVLKRWGYDWKNIESGKTSADEERHQETDESPALWGIDLEKLKQLNGPLTFSAPCPDTAGLPVYSPQAARAYLFRSFDTAPVTVPTETDSPKAKKRTNAMAVAEREANVAALLKALDTVFQSWSSTLSAEELDKRAWSWYVSVRPDVEHGVAGWGAKGPIKLTDILALRRPD